MTFDLVYAILQILVEYRHEKSGWAVGKPSSPFSFSDSQIKGLLKDDRGNGWHAVINGSHVVSSLKCENVTCFQTLCLFDINQLQPHYVTYDFYEITNPKFLEMAVSHRSYPPSITYVVTYPEELRKTGRPVWVTLELLGADNELTFSCKAYEPADNEDLNGARKGE